MKTPQTPIFIFEKKKLEQNYKELENLCKKYFSSFKIAYSVKTNSNKEVIKVLGKLGSNFEIASQEEIKLIPKTFTVFNSPAKTQEELKTALKNKFLINIDSISEIDKISRIIKNKKIQAGLRISISDSKFGIEDSKIEQAIEYANSKGIEIVCLHLHQGTQVNLKEYEENLIIFENIVERLSKNNKAKLKYLDIGGGLPDKQQLKNLSLSLNNYLEVISKHLSKFNKTIILEPGRSLVSDSFYLLTKVITIKENFNKTYAILDAGINLLPKITLASYKYTPYNHVAQDVKNGLVINNNPQKEYLLAGPLLFSNDILGKFQGNLQEGDLIKVENVGAYCYNLAWEISYKKPKII